MIHKIKYDWKYSKESILKKIYKNKSIKKELGGNTSLNTDEIMFYSDELESIRKFIISQYFSYKQILHSDYAFNMWSYIQTNQTIDEVFHKHIKLDGGRTEIPAEDTFVFYLQIPPNLKEGEGDLLFKFDDETIQSFKPSEGDIIFFPANMWHVPTLTPSSDVDRVVLAGNISLNFLPKKELV